MKSNALRFGLAALTAVAALLAACGESNSASSMPEESSAQLLSFDWDDEGSSSSIARGSGDGSSSETTSSEEGSGAGASSTDGDPTSSSQNETTSLSVGGDGSSSSADSAGTSSGELVSSSSEEPACEASGMFRDARDGKTYGYVTIGGKIWMSQNLDHASVGSMCYGDDAANCEQYGRLYLQAEAAAACPEGWTVPTRDEGNALIGNGAPALLASGTNATGFSALLGGSSNGNMGKYGIYWISQTDYDIRLASNEAVILQAAEGEYAAVRCVHDTVYAGICIPGAGNSQAGGMSSETQTTSSSQEQSSSSSEEQTSSSSQEQSSSSSEQIPATHVPSVSIEGTLTQVTINDTVGFSIRNLQDAAGVSDIGSYDWNFGDGQTIHKTDSSGLKHAWTTAGTYTVTLRVTDSNGDYAEDAITITILLGVPEADAGADMACHNNTACVFSGTANDPNTGSQKGSGNIMKYLWDYEGDGVFDDSSATNSFSHAYADTSATAAYTAKFCARDDDNNEVCDTTHVSVSNRAPSLTGFIMGKLVATNTYGLFVDSLKFADADDNLQPVLYWDLDEDGIFETARQSADTVVLQTDDGALRHIAVYGKDRWGESSDTVRAMYGKGPQLLDSRDGKTYATIAIGTQLWMAQNLNYRYWRPYSDIGNWCYKDSAKYCAQYGRLYSWAAAMDSLTTGCGYIETCTASTRCRDPGICTASTGKVQGICPDGWHIPSLAEWDTLFASVGGFRMAETALKSTTGWTNNENGTNAVGFSALPSGERNDDGEFSLAGEYARFWSSSDYDAYEAWYAYLNAFHQAGRGVFRKKRGYAVRCVKD